MPFRLATCPGPVRALCTGFLLAIGLGLLVAILEVHDAMGGLAPAAVADTLRGDTERAAAAEFAEDFGEDDFGPGDDLSFGKGYREMLQTAHTHSLAVPLLFFALGAVFLGTDVGDRAQSAVLAPTFAIVVLDLATLWLVRYVAAGFAFMSVATGGAMGACAAALILRSLYDLWRPRPVAPEPGDA